MNVKLVVLIGLLNLWSFFVLAQPPLLGERREEIEKIKKEFVTNRINLTEEQAEKFWPVYDAYTQERIKLRRQVQKLKQSGFSMAATDEQLKASIDQMFELREKEFKLDKEVKTKLLEVLTVRQLAELYRSEQEFLQAIIKAWRDR
ncbi:MAG: hypothetical protein NW226_10690 [Microscillaceae bacterium]|nr:hypothetical protein [Microscillaceae bacterium]